MGKIIIDKVIINDQKMIKITDVEGIYTKNELPVEYTHSTKVPIWMINKDSINVYGELIKLNVPMTSRKFGRVLSKIKSIYPMLDAFINEISKYSEDDNKTLESVFTIGKSIKMGVRRSKKTLTILALNNIKPCSFLPVAYLNGKSFWLNTDKDIVMFKNIFMNEDFNIKVGTNMSNSVFQGVLDYMVYCCVKLEKINKELNHLQTHWVGQQNINYLEENYYDRNLL